MIYAIAALIGAFIYRMRGGMGPSFPRPIDQLLFSLPYGYLAALSGAVSGAIVLVLTTASVAKGHGNTMDLGDYDCEPEWYEFLIRGWLHGRISLYWYDFVGHCISGLSCTLLAGVVCGDPLLAISGILKGPAYALAKKADAGTEGGELLTGALLWCCAAYSIFGA